MPLARRDLEKGRKEVTGENLRGSKDQVQVLYRHLLFHALRASLSRTTTLNFLLSNFLENMKEGDLLLQAGLSGYLHLSPGNLISI